MNPAQVVIELFDRGVAKLRASGCGRAINTQTSTVESQSNPTLVRELGGRNFTKELNRSTGQAEARLIDDVWRYRPSPGGRV